MESVVRSGRTLLFPHTKKMSAELASLRAYVTDDAGRRGLNQAVSTVRLNVEHASLKARFVELRLDKHVRFFFSLLMLRCRLLVLLGEGSRPAHSNVPASVWTRGWRMAGGASRVARCRFRWRARARGAFRFQCPAPTALSTPLPRPSLSLSLSDDHRRPQAQAGHPHGHVRGGHGPHPQRRGGRRPGHPTHRPGPPAGVLFA